MNKFPKLIATSVVRGSQQGESHGGIYTLDFENQVAEQRVDWNTGEIDFEGRGADRGLRGITFDGNDIYVAASDELFCYDRDFRIQSSWRNRYLKHCHEIIRKDRYIFLTSTGFDSLLVFDIDKKAFVWGINLVQQAGWGGRIFDPRLDTGPPATNKWHINSVFVDDTGIYLSGLRAPALLHINSNNEVTEVCSLPLGTHNARPFRDGLIFNDTDADVLRYVARSGEQQTFSIKQYPESDIELAGIDDSKIARQGFGRGLCLIDDRFIAGGSSPSTISLYDLDANQMVGCVNISMDIRNAIHGLEVFPESDVTHVI